MPTLTLDEFPHLTDPSASTAMQLRMRFHKTIFFMDSKVFVSDSELVAAASSNVPAPWLPHPWPPYFPNTPTGIRKLAATKMFYGMAPIRIETASSDQTDALIYGVYNERGNIDPQSSMVLSGEVTLHLDGNVTFAGQFPDTGYLHPSLLVANSNPQKSYFVAMLQLGIQQFIEGVA